MCDAAFILCYGLIIVINCDTACSVASALLNTSVFPLLLLLICFSLFLIFVILSYLSFSVCFIIHHLVHVWCCVSFSLHCAYVYIYIYIYIYSYCDLSAIFSLLPFVNIGGPCQATPSSLDRAFALMQAVCGQNMFRDRHLHANDRM